MSAVVKAEKQARPKTSSALVQELIAFMREERRGPPAGDPADLRLQLELIEDLLERGIEHERERAPRPDDALRPGARERHVEVCAGAAGASAGQPGARGARDVGAATCRTDSAASKGAREMSPDGPALYDWAREAPCDQCPQARRCRERLEACEAFALYVDGAGEKSWAAVLRAPERALYVRLLLVRSDRVRRPAGPVGISHRAVPA